MTARTGGATRSASRGAISMYSRPSRLSMPPQIGTVVGSPTDSVCSRDHARGESPSRGPCGLPAFSGYLSSNPPRVHFGLPAGERPRRLTIRWPDGSVDVVDAAHGLAADTLLTVTRQHPPAP